MIDEDSLQERNAAILLHLDERQRRRFAAARVTRIAASTMSEQADVPFALGLTPGNLGEGGNAAEPDVVDPSPGLGDCGEQSVPQSTGVLEPWFKKWRFDAESFLRNSDPF
jgi:hypothetical protein